MKSLNTIRVPRRAVLSIIWDFLRIAPFPVCVSIFLRCLNAGARGFSPIVIAGVTNALINAENRVFWATMYLVLLGVELLTDVLNLPTQLWFSNKAILYFQSRLLQQASKTPLLRFLDPDFHDNLDRATRDFSDRVVNWFESVLANIHSVATIIALLGSVIVIGGGVWCVVILFLSSVIILLTRTAVARLEHELDQDAARPRRILATWTEHLSDRDSGAEIRLFSLQEWLLAKWEKFYRALAGIEITALKRKMRWDAVAGIFYTLGYVGIIYIAAYTAQKAAGNEVAGVFTGLIAAAVTLQGFLSSVAYGLGSLAENSRILRELATLFVREPEAERETEDLSSQASTAEAMVQIEALSFRYPRLGDSTLKDITASIAPGEIVALVGKNGSGKTTLANILLGLYTPNTGTLQFSKEYTTPSGPSRSAVFQNFVKFLLPVRDNVGFADVNSMQDDNRMKGALQRAGSNLGQNLDAWLGHEFGGRDVSGGEWLRIAVARGLFRPSNFVVFDEPTAAIDPVAEVEIIRELLTKNESRSILIISHRLGVARFCDRVIVLDAGQLVENGSHDELLAKNGLYAQMWQAQASWYA